MLKDANMLTRFSRQGPSADCSLLTVFFFFRIVVRQMFVSSLCPLSQNTKKKKKSPTDAPYSPLDSVKCVMGYTQSVLPLKAKVVLRSAWARSPESRL